MGRIGGLKYGISADLHEDLQTIPLFAPDCMSAASSQLVSLELDSNETIWKVIFQLTALTSLGLQLDDTGTQPQLPAQRSLPHLAKFTTYTGSECLPLLNGAALPSLHRLGVSGNINRKTLSLAGIGHFPKLRELDVDDWTILPVI